MVKKRKYLLADFISERVNVMLTSKNAVMLDSGEIAEVPMIIEGIFIDYDDEFILLGFEGVDAPELVDRRRIVSIKLGDRFSEVMADPSKPKKAGDSH